MSSHFSCFSKRQINICGIYAERCAKQCMDMFFVTPLSKHGHPYSRLTKVILKKSSVFLNDKFYLGKVSCVLNPLT